MLLLKRGPGGHRPPGLWPTALALGAAAAAVATLVQGCDAADVGAVPVTHPVTDPPIYRAVYGQQSAMLRIADADHKLIAACMARRGFTYRSAPPSRSGPVADPRPAPFGRESASAPVEPGPAAEPSEEPGKFGPAYARALHGDPSRRVSAQGARMKVSGPADGCIAEARHRLLGADRVRWMRLRVLLFEAEEDARRDLDRDHRFREVMTRWRECVHTAGYDWPDPLRALADRTGQAARADVECKRRTGYLATAYAGLAAAQQRRLDRNPGLLTDWMTLLRKQEDAARSIAAS